MLFFIAYQFENVLHDGEFWNISYPFENNLQWSYLERVIRIKKKKKKKIDWNSKLPSM